MPKHVRILGSRATGLEAEDEDMWRLVFDVDTKHLYVEHLWDHVSTSDSGTREIEITAFLASEEGEGKSELHRLIESLFTLDQN